MATYKYASNIRDNSNCSNVNYHIIMLLFPKPLILCKLQCQILLCAAFITSCSSSSNSHNHCHTRCAKKDHFEKFLTVCMTNLWKESLLVIRNASRAPDRKLNNLRYGMPFAQKVKLCPGQSHWRWIDQIQKVNNNTPPADLLRNATRWHGHYGVTLWHWPTLGWDDDDAFLWHHIVELNIFKKVHFWPTLQQKYHVPLSSSCVHRRSSVTCQ